MIEFSFADLVLLVWAVAATAYAFDYKHKEKLARMVVFKIIEDPHIYQNMRDSYVEHTKDFFQSRKQA